MGKSHTEIQKGDVVWAPYRRDPLWPALVRNSYPKKVTYVFFPLPRETAQKKSPTFSCLPKSVRALSVDDVLPPDSKNDLREAFNAAIKYLSMKGLPRGSAAPLRSPQRPSKGTTPADVRKESRKSAVAVAKEKVEVPTEVKAERKLVDDKPDLPADISMEESIQNHLPPAGHSNSEDRMATSRLHAKKEREKEKSPAVTTAVKEKPSDDLNSCLAKRQPLNPTPPRTSAFAADSTTHSDTSPSPDLLAPVLFREATQILEQVWATDLVQNYVTPTRAGLRFETHTGGLLTDHETDTLFEMIFNWVRDREKDSYYLPGVHLVLEVLMPEIIIQSLMQARGVSREVAELTVRNTSDNVASCSSSTGSEITNSPRTTASNGIHKVSGSLDALARIACKERESITE
ncbi:hypothetical protein Q1695_010036 [Nippostrongylus brasiliensis]|nr:hypothetical protein Q1695_010036 [Nippostrongylus brasiliensis]